MTSVPIVPLGIADPIPIGPAGVCTWIQSNVQVAGVWYYVRIRMGLLGFLC
jgi:hypothetical protein